MDPVTLIVAALAAGAASGCRRHCLHRDQRRLPEPQAAPDRPTQWPPRGRGGPG